MKIINNMDRKIEIKFDGRDSIFLSVNETKEIPAQTFESIGSISLMFVLGKRGRKKKIIQEVVQTNDGI